MKDIMDLFAVIENSEGRGALLFVLITIYFTMVQIFFYREWTSGLKGSNKSWDSPEVIIYLFNLVWPISIFADQLLKLPASEWAWIFMISVLGFALLGKVGFESILNWRTKILGSKAEKKDDTKQPQI